MTDERPDQVAAAAVTDHKGIPARLRWIMNGTANVCGVLALIISVSWTFPNEVLRAYFSTQESMEEDVAEAIKAMSSIYKEFTLSQAANLSDQVRFTLTTISAAQIGYELDKVSRFPDTVFQQSSYTENLVLAGLAYQISKYDDALRFNDAAVHAAERERVEPQEAYLGQANARLGRDGIAGIDAARKAYKLAFVAAVNRQRSGRFDFVNSPLSALIEISLGELRFGSWECGDSLASVVELQLNRPEIKQFPIAQNMLAVYRSNRSSVAKTVGRLPFDCDYLALQP